MHKYILFLLVIIGGIGLLSLDLRGGSQKTRSSSTIAIADKDCTYTVTIYCCCDTCRVNSVTFSNLMLVAKSPSDSAFLSQLPHQISFKNVSEGEVKMRKGMMSMPGMKLKGPLKMK